jgi:hypothetical protein
MVAAACYYSWLARRLLAISRAPIKIALAAARTAVMAPA